MLILSIKKTKIILMVLGVFYIDTIFAGDASLTELLRLPENSIPEAIKLGITEKNFFAIEKETTRLSAEPGESSKVSFKKIKTSGAEMVVLYGFSNNLDRLEGVSVIQTHIQEKSHHKEEDILGYMCRSLGEPSIYVTETHLQKIFPTLIWRRSDKTISIGFFENKFLYRVMMRDSETESRFTLENQSISGASASNIGQLKIFCRKQSGIPI